MPHSVSEFIRFYNSPFSYWCNKTNKLVDEKKIDAKYKIQINASKLISKQLLTKAQEHEVVLKDKYRISEALMTTYKLIWDDFCSSLRFFILLIFVDFFAAPPPSPPST